MGLQSALSEAIPAYSSDQKKPYSIEDGKIFKVIIERMVPMAWHFLTATEDIARALPEKTRRIVGIILLSGGIILSIIGLVLMNLIDDSDAMILIPLILLGLGIIIMILSISFFRKFEDRGWLEDALFYWSFWYGDDWDVNEVQENMKQQIDCSSCNQKLNIPFSYSGNISCPACGINMELEEGIIQAEGNPSD